MKLKKREGKRSTKQVPLQHAKRVREWVIQSVQGWNAASYDDWLARKVEAGEIKVAQAHPQHSDIGKEEAELKAQGGGKKHRASRQHSVRRWLARRGNPQQVTSAMVRTMEQDLSRPQGIVEIHAALLLCAVAGEVTVEDMRQGDGGSAPPDIVGDAVAWMVQKQWISQEEAQQVEAAGRTVYTQRAQQQTVLLELGSGWEGATQGLRQEWDRVVTMDRKAQQSRGRQCIPDILGEFSDGLKHEQGLVTWAREKAQIKKEELGAVWASVDCTEESTSQGMQKGRKGMKPRGVFAGARRSRKATNAIKAVYRGIAKARANNPRLQYAVENPAYSALREVKGFKKAFGKGIVVVGCAYGLESGKKFRLWLSPETEKHFKPIHPASKKSRCKVCKSGGGRHKYAAIPKKGDTRPRIHKDGESVTAAANMIPTLMAVHVGRAMKRAWEEACQ